MPEEVMTLADRVRNLRDAARRAVEAETEADHAAEKPDGDDDELEALIAYDEACAEALGLILSPEGSAAFDQIERLLTRERLS